MLLGINKEGEVKFIFTDENYLAKQFPDNTAKISNFWKFEHGLSEFFISKKDFPDYNNYKSYQLVNGNLIKTTEKEETHEMG